jgi:hypothetical protein
MKRCPLDCNPEEPAKCDPLHKSPTIINATLKHRGSNSIATIPARRRGAAARRRRPAAPARPRRPARARPAPPLPTLHEQRCHINSQTDAATDRLNPRGLSVAERAVRRPPRNETPNDCRQPLELLGMVRPLGQEQRTQCIGIGGEGITGGHRSASKTHRRARVAPRLASESLCRESRPAAWQPGRPPRPTGRS